jgi:transposase
MQAIHVGNGKAVLAVSLELCSASWKIAATDGRRERPSVYGGMDARQPADRLDQLVQRLDALKGKWALPGDCEVWLLYEAGQDGFWIARALRARGLRVVVVDPASIPVSRQARRAKTDRLDALKLLDNLLAWLRGERQESRMVSIPSEQAEAQRQLARDRGELQKEIGQHRDRIRKLLRLVGCWEELQGDVDKRLRAGELQCWDGQALAEPLRQRLQRECERLELVRRQLADLERNLLGQLPQPLQERIAQLAQLKGVGWIGAMRLVLELYWRNFHNRRQVGACLGLVSQPYDSGASRVDQGISKQGNRKVRSLIIEMAWMWLRHQPGSAISQWFAARTAGNPANKRGKRIAIVAVARRLAVALWRYLEDGVVPHGAQSKRA